MSVEKIPPAKKLKEASLNRYVNWLRIEPNSNKLVYWIDRKHLYVSDPEIEVVSISAYFEDDVPKALLFPDCYCNAKAPPIDECKNPLDFQFKAPGYLENNIVEMTSKYLIETYFRLEDDKTSDNKDDEKLRG